jgi:hypothetical protein
MTSAIKAKYTNAKQETLFVVAFGRDTFHVQCQGPRGGIKWNASMPAKLVRQTVRLGKFS